MRGTLRHLLPRGYSCLHVKWDSVAHLREMRAQQNMVLPCERFTLPVRQSGQVIGVCSLSAHAAPHGRYWGAQWI